MSHDEGQPFRGFVACAALMLTQAATGLLVPSLYRDPQPWVLSAWRGNDVVTLVVAVPVLLWSTWRARAGSVRGLLLALGALWYCFYNDAYYLFGAALGPAFPLYSVLMVTCAVTLVVAVSRLDWPRVTSAFARAPARPVAGVLVFVGVVLALVWFAQWAAYIWTGRIDRIGPEAVRLIAAMDTVVIAPSLVFGGVLLWRRRPAGFVLATLGATLGGGYALVLVGGTLAAAAAGLPGMELLPLWLGLAVVLLGALGALLWRVEATS
ncbi:MAG: hypothetical protein ACOZQL_20700 [Myxococcota bacterium]